MLPFTVNIVCEEVIKKMTLSTYLYGEVASSVLSLARVDAPRLSFEPDT